MAGSERVLDKHNGEENKQTANDTSREEFNCVARTLLEQSKRIKVERAAFAQNNPNFIGNSFTVEEDRCVEQLLYEGNVVDLDIPEEEDDVFKLLCTHFLELERFLYSSKLEQFHQKLCQQKESLCLFMLEVGSLKWIRNYLWMQTTVNDNLLYFQKMVVPCRKGVFFQLFSCNGVEVLQFQVKNCATQDLYIKHGCTSAI